jgi:hypothetical protein
VPAQTGPLDSALTLACAAVQSYIQVQPPQTFFKLHSMFQLLRVRGAALLLPITPPTPCLQRWP